ncbi:MAG TPA: hypothetical protein VK941_06735 [Gillisia sp.]|nr:hypothetical protein [Gillisia sp.]
MLYEINDALAVDRLEGLRIPFENWNCPTDWKDWYHYILLDPQSGNKILVNVSLSNKPGGGEIQVSVIIQLRRTRSEYDTYAEVRSVPWENGMVKRSPLLIKTSNTLLEIKNGISRIMFAGKNSDIELEFSAKANSVPFLIEEQTRFGSGFIGWGFIPNMVVNGSFKVCRTVYKLTPSWHCYHDRNFGRFRWGEDIGWEWFVATLKDDKGTGWQAVFDVRSNKDHTHRGFQYIFLFRDNKLKKVFVGNTLQLTWNRSPQTRTPLRMPGNMATVMAGRVAAQIDSIILTARDDRDHIKITLQTEKAFELIVPDHKIRQYTVMEEISGKAILETHLGGKNVKSKGQFYAEFVR